MQFKSFMEALKGKQHKIDKNKNGQIDAHDFKLLRKEESEESAETIEESEERMARADYKVGASGRKSHKEIVFNDAESKEDDKKEMKEAKMSDADMAERERIVKGMKKNLSGFKARYGKDAKSVMYATATKQAMKEETVEEAVQKADIPAYLRKQQGQTPLKLSDLKRKDTISDKENLAKLRNEEAEELDEKSDQAKRNKTMKNMMDASRGARYKLNNPVPDAEPEHKTARAHNVAIGRALRKEDAEQVEEGYYEKPASAYRRKGDEIGGGSSKNDVPFDGPYTKSKPVKNSDGTTQSPMSRARELAKQGIAASRMDQQAKRKIKEAKDEQEYGYEGDMAMNQLATLTRCAEMIKDTLKPDTDLPEWVQSKITLATDYIVTAADYLHSELEEQAPVAPVPDKKYIKGTPEHKAYKATKKPINGMPTNKMSCEEVDEAYSMDDVRKDAAAHLNKSMDKQSNDRIAALKNPPAKKGFFAKVGQKQINMVKGAYKGLTKEETALDEVEKKTLSYSDFVSTLLEYETKDGRYVHKGTYGGNYVDPEGADDADDKKPMKPAAEKKRGRGRPAGAKSGARKITGTSKLFK
jgi:hypothetical protein